jgi:hypothetical protein
MRLMTRFVNPDDREYFNGQLPTILDGLFATLPTKMDPKLAMNLIWELFTNLGTDAAGEVFGENTTFREWLSEYMASPTVDRGWRGLSALFTAAAEGRWGWALELIRDELEEVAERQAITHEQSRRFPCAAIRLVVNAIATEGAGSATDAFMTFLAAELGQASDIDQYLDFDVLCEQLDTMPWKFVRGAIASNALNYSRQRVTEMLRRHGMPAPVRYNYF